MNEFNWSEKQVLVTGGAGFLGSHLVEHLQTLGTKRIVVPRSKEYDLREKYDVIRMFEDNPGTDVVIHLAATVGGIGANRKNPGRFFYDNIMMGTLMLEYSRLYEVEKFVGIGTVCSYPKITPMPFQEDNLWEGFPEETNAPYGIAKRALLMQGMAYRDEYGFNAIHVLPTNLYGPGDTFDPARAHVIPDVIRKMVEAQEDGTNRVVLFGDGSPTREFLYVKDAVRGIALAAAHYNKREPVNLGSGMEISIKDLVELIAELLDFKGALVWDTSKPNGQPRRHVSTERARSAFGFEATTDFRQGLQELIAWYKANRKIAEAPLQRS